MKPARPVYIAAGAHTPFIGKFHPDFIWKKHPDFGVLENPYLEHYMTQPARDAFEEYGIDPKAIDGGVASNFVGECFEPRYQFRAPVADVRPEFGGELRQYGDGNVQSARVRPHRVAVNAVPENIRGTFGEAQH